jgi:hypothetical protein
LTTSGIGYGITEFWKLGVIPHQLILLDAAHLFYRVIGQVMMEAEIY